MKKIRSSRGVTAPALGSPRFKKAGAFLFAGLKRHYNARTRTRIPMQWTRFLPYLGKIPGQVGGATYGVCFRGGADGEDGFEYLTGVQVSEFAGLPARFGEVSIPAKRYAVFTHKGHVSGITQTIGAIFDQWLPESGRHLAHEAGGSLTFFERYGEGFDPKTGTGPMELWIPVRE